MLRLNALWRQQLRWIIVVCMTQFGCARTIARGDSRNMARKPWCFFNDSLVGQELGMVSTVSEQEGGLQDTSASIINDRMVRLCVWAKSHVTAYGKS